MFHKNQVDDTETVDKLFDLIIDEDDSKLAKDRLSLAEDTVSMGNRFLDLIDGMFFLYVVEGVLKVRKLQLNVLG
jgi:hypothetical protein